MHPQSYASYQSNKSYLSGKGASMLLLYCILFYVLFLYVKFLRENSFIYPTTNSWTLFKNWHSRHLLLFIKLYSLELNFMNYHLKLVGLCDYGFCILHMVLYLLIEYFFAPTSPYHIFYKAFQIFLNEVNIIISIKLFWKIAQVLSEHEIIFRPFSTIFSCTKSLLYSYMDFHLLRFWVLKICAGFKEWNATRLSFFQSLESASTTLKQFSDHSNH